MRSVQIDSTSPSDKQSVASDPSILDEWLLACDRDKVNPRGMKM